MVSSLPLTTLFSEPSSIRRPLCIDIDGTLRNLAHRKELLAALRASHSEGRRLVILTSADATIARQAYADLSLFDDCLGLTREGPDTSKKGLLLSAHGEKGFDCLGDSSTDIGIFEAASQAFVWGASARTRARVSHLKHVTILSRLPSIPRAVVKQLRPHQWAKNALLFLPVLLAPKIPSLAGLTQAVMAMIAFSFSASAGYVFNDLLDVEADRMHATKCNRPFASGALPRAFGPPLLISLMALSVVLSWAYLPLAFLVMLGVYFFGTLSYSLYFKRLLMLDVLVLAALYTHRILSGGIATGVTISTWLLGFSMFLFTSLAFAKRYVELRALTNDARVRNRGYFRADVEMVASMGTSSGFIAALVFMLYVDSAKVRDSYRDPSILWLVLPILLYWLGRIWLLAGRGHMRDDPVKFALKDGTSLACAAAIAIVAMAARFSPGWISAGFH